MSTISLKNAVSGSPYRHWSQPVLPRSRLRKNLQVTLQGNGMNAYDLRVKQVTGGGLMEMSLRNYYRANSDRGFVGATELKFTDTSNLFMRTLFIEVVLRPVVNVSDRHSREGSPWFSDSDQKGVDLSDQENTVTLWRQLDGSYLTTSARGKAFFLVQEGCESYLEHGTVSNADAVEFVGVRFALTANGLWDNNGGQDYLLSR